MLKEIHNVRQIPGESRRRCFSDTDMDLTIWLNAREEITGFELCYDKGAAERAVRWMRDAGFAHVRVDDGEQKTGKKGTPILIKGGLFDGTEIPRLFLEHSREIDEKATRFVYQKLVDYSEGSLP